MYFIKVFGREVTVTEWWHVALHAIGATIYKRPLAHTYDWEVAE
jgi:hypothetical protein